MRLTGQPGEDPRSAQLYTERLSLDTADEVTDTEVAGRARASATTGCARCGMRADLKAGTLRLESDVNGHFAP